MFSATKLLGGLMEKGVGGGGGMLGTAAKVAGVAAVGGIAYGAYRHHQAGGFGQGGPGLFGGGDAPPGAPPGAPPPGQPAGGGNPFGGGAQPAAGHAFGGGAPAGQPAGGNPLGGGAQPGTSNPFGGGAPAGAPAGGNPFGGGAQPAAASPFGGGPPAGTPQKSAPAPQAAAQQTDQENQALLLVRAMIAAAYIDGGLDPQERTNILKAAENAGMGAAERQALEHELQHPHRVNVLLGTVQDLELAKQVYLVTLLAVDRNNAPERAYVAGLPLYLGIPPADVAGIHQQLGLAG